MSLLLSLLASAAIEHNQLCYHAEQDIGSHHWLSQASLLESQLSTAVKNQTSICIPLTKPQEYQEAVKLVAADETTVTLTIEQH